MRLLLIPPSIWELPPRARRIHAHGCTPDNYQGTTSACAENTSGDSNLGKISGNYLRVRGEYCVRLRAVRKQLELPPRARRIRGEFHQVPTGFGTTSACAENTS